MIANHHDAVLNSDPIHGEINTLTQMFFWLLSHETLTCTETCARLGIYRPTGCRIKRALEKAGRLREVRKRICRITKAVASELTCNPERFPIDPQLSLFGWAA